MKKVLSIILLLSLIVLTSCSQPKTVDQSDKSLSNNGVTSSRDFNTNETSGSQSSKSTVNKQTEVKSTESDLNNQYLNRLIETGEPKGAFYLKRNNTLFSLNHANDYVAESTAGTARNPFYLSEDSKVIVCNTLNYIPSFEPNDKIVSYSDNIVLKLTLSKADFAGYTLCTLKKDAGGGGYYHFIIYQNGTYSEDIMIKNGDVHGVDKNEKEVESRFGLTQGEEYTVYWYEGTKYHEYKMKADYPYYQVHDKKSDDYYEIEGTLTKNGYAEYDISNIPAGIYQVFGGGLLQIK